MSILRVASFMVMVMPEVLCWPNMSNVAALYVNEDIFLNFEELEKVDAMEFIAIAFKNYYYVENVDVTLGAF